MRHQVTVVDVRHGGGDVRGAQREGNVAHSGSHERERLFLLARLALGVLNAVVILGARSRTRSTQRKARLRYVHVVVYQYTM